VKSKVLFLNFIARHMFRHLGMNVAVLFCFSLGAGLLGSLPTFAAITAEKALESSLVNAHPSVRNIKVEAPLSILSSALNGYINESLGDLVDERIFVNNIQRNAHSSAPLIIGEQEVYTDLEGIWIWSFDKLTQHTSLLKGEWPVVTYPISQADALGPPTIQAAITEEIASLLQIQVGDLLQDNNEYKYLVTGIIQINDPAEDMWWQDSSPIYLTIEPGLNEDTISAPIFIHSSSMREYFFGYASEWRYILQPEIINISNAETVESDLANLKNRLSANKAKMTSGLPNLVQDFRKDLSTSRMVLYLLSIQAFLFVIFTLILMATLLVNNSLSEMAALTSRGASRYQIILTFAFQMLILAIIAGFIMGPLLTWIGLHIWGWISGDRVPGLLPIETWQMSILAAGIGWFAVVMAIIPATRSGLLDWQQSVSRPSQATAWQKKYIDIFLLLFGALLYWQLSSSGSFVMRRIKDSDFADPLLLIGPSLLLIALAMLYLRLFPIILNGLTSLTKSGRGIVLPLGLTRIARNPQRLSWIVLLISLASGLILFAKIYSESLNSTQVQIARYIAGSNLRLDANQIQNSHIAEIEEVLPISQVLRGRVQENSGRGITILAVDPETFVNVSEYPSGMTNLTIDIIMQAINQPAEIDQGEESTSTVNTNSEPKQTTPAIPAIISYSTLPKGGKIGDHLELLMAGQPITFEIRGIIADFPTLSTDFLIVNSNTFENVVSTSIATQLRNSEYWISTDEQNHDQLVSLPFIRNAILADSTKILNIIRNNIMTLGTVRAFGLNGLILAIISLVGLLLANYFSFRQREYEFGILRAYGLSRGQSNLLLVSEGILVLVLGLISGIILGYSLTKLMRPYISLAVSRTLPGMTVHQIDINWLSVATIVGLLTALYCIAMALIVFALWRSNIHQVLGTGDE
jgi:putative ABC transport system permease protein